MTNNIQGLFNKNQIEFIRKLIRTGEVDVKDMATELGVSKATIYNYYNYMKDLSFSRSKGKIVLKRQNGDGVDETISDTLTRRLLYNSKAKEICAAYIVKNYIEQGDALFLDGGSASIFVADQIREQEKADLTVVTTNPYVFNRLFDYKNIERLMVVGGESRSDQGIFQGAWTNSIIDGLEFNFQTAIIEISGFGIHNDSCVVSVSDPGEVLNKRRIMDRSAKVLFPADKSKINKIFVELARKDDTWGNYWVVLGVEDNPDDPMINEIKNCFDDNLIIARQ